jgi:hypothetical protein
MSYYNKNILITIGLNMQHNPSKYDYIFYKDFIANLHKQLLDLNLEMDKLTNEYNELTKRNTIIKLKNNFAFIKIDSSYYNNLSRIEEIDEKIVQLEKKMQDIKSQLENS